MKKLYFVLAFFLTLGAFAQSGSYFGRYAGTVGLNQGTIRRASAIGYNAKVGISDGLVLGDTLLVKVGIGTAYPQHPLDVRGVINMRAALNQPALKINDRYFLGLDPEGEFVVSRFKMRYEDLKQWSDRVFEKNYRIMSLVEVERFIEANGHLPNIPSAQEVVQKGVAMDEIVAKLLEKVEELTLHSIRQQKEIEALKRQLKK